MGKSRATDFLHTEGARDRMRRSLDGRRPQVNPSVVRGLLCPGAGEGAGRRPPRRPRSPSAVPCGLCQRSCPKGLGGRPRSPHAGSRRGSARRGRAACALCAVGDAPTTRSMALPNWPPRSARPCSRSTAAVPPSHARRQPRICSRYRRRLRQYSASSDSPGPSPRQHGIEPGARLPASGLRRGLRQQAALRTRNLARVVQRRRRYAFYCGQIGHSAVVRWRHRHGQLSQRAMQMREAIRPSSPAG